MLQEDSSENDEVLKSIYFCHVGKFSYSSKHALYFINYLFFYCLEDNIPSCEAHKQFGAEPAQYGLEINFNSTVTYSLPHLNVQNTT